MHSKGFTLIEVIIVTAVVVFLSGIILFGITQYLNNGKDSNLIGNLAVLIPAGEVYYNSNENSYSGFCASDVFENAVTQSPQSPDGSCQGNEAGICCAVNANGDMWAACARKFSNANLAFCVDSRGLKKDIDATSCIEGIIKCN